MSLQKAIHKYARYYIIFFSALTIVSALRITNGLDFAFLLLVLFLAVLPVLFVILSSKNKWLITANYLLILLILVFFAASFKTLRDLFPNPIISENTSIGYAQYFGYPLYLDSYIFFIIILSPVLFFTIMKLRKNVTHHTIKKK